MRRAGLTVALAFAAFASAADENPAAPLGATAMINEEPADVLTAMQNILIQTEGTVPSSVALGSGDLFKVSNQAGPEAVVFVIPELKVAAAADKPAEGLGCYTIGDVENKVALLMCEGVDTDVTPAAKEGFDWVKGTITNKGTTDLCQVNFASADLKLAEVPDLLTVPTELKDLTPFKLVPGETKNYAFQLPIDSIKEGIPAIGIKDSLGPCGLIEQAKEAMAKQLAENEKAAAAAKAVADAAAQAAADATPALPAVPTMPEAPAGGIIADAIAAVTGDVKDTTSGAVDATKAAADEAAAATAKAAAEAEALKLKMEEEAAALKAKADETAAAAAKVGEIKLNGEEEEAAKAEVTSPAPKMSASVMALFTVAVLVAVQLLL